MGEQTSQKEKVMGKINEIKKNVESFIADVNVNDLKESLNTMVKDAQKDFSNLVDKDLGALKNKFTKEKTDLEKKAKKFFDNHKKEISALQAKFDKMVKSAGKKSAPKVAKAKVSAPTTKKKVMKKVAKATAAPKKSTKKTAKKK
jgi:vacuolar-type H+-ATPase subunit H